LDNAAQKTAKAGKTQSGRNLSPLKAIKGKKYFSIPRAGLPRPLVAPESDEGGSRTKAGAPLKNP